MSLASPDIKKEVGINPLPQESGTSSPKILEKILTSIGILGAGYLGINSGPSVMEGVLKAFRSPQKAFAAGLMDYTALPSLVDKCIVVHPKNLPAYPIKTEVIKGVKIGFPDQSLADINTQAAYVDQNYQSWFINRMDSFQRYFLGISTEGELINGIVMARKPLNEYSSPDELAEEVRSKIPASYYAYNPTEKKYTLLNYIPLQFYGAYGRTLNGFGEMTVPSFIYNDQAPQYDMTIRHEAFHGLNNGLHNPDFASIMNTSALGNPSAGLLESDIQGICEMRFSLYLPTIQKWNH